MNMNWYKLAGKFGEPYFRNLNIPEEKIGPLLDYLEQFPDKVQNYIVKKYVRRKENPVIDVEELQELVKDIDVKKETKIDPEMEKAIIGITGNKDEREWLRKLVQSGRFQAEDSGKVIYLLDELHNLPDNLKKPISDFKDDTVLTEYIDRYRPKKELEEIPEGAELLENYDTDAFNVQLYRITTQEAIKEMGARGWCTTHGHRYDPLEYYCFYIDGKPEVLIHLKSNQIKDRSDAQLKYGPFVKAIEPAVSKYGLDESKSGDFEKYHRASSDVRYLNENPDDEEYIIEIINRDVTNIVLLDKEHWGKYLYLLNNDMVYDQLSNLGPTFFHYYAAYVKSKSEEEFEDLQRRVVEDWAKKTDTTDLTVGRYKKVFPKILRTPYVNGVFNKNRIEGWVGRLIERWDDPNYYNPATEDELGDYMWYEPPEDLKSNPDIIDAWKQGSIKNLIKNPIYAWEELLEEEKSNPDIIDAWKQGLANKICKEDMVNKESSTIGWVNANEELKSDPDLWIKILEQDPFNNIWLRCPEHLRSDPDIIQAKRQGWINLLTKDPGYFCVLPEELKSDPEIFEARRQGWIKLILRSSRFDVFSECEEDLKSDPDILAAWKQSWIGRLKGGDLLEWIDCPDEFKSDPDIIWTWKRGCIEHLEEVPLMDKRWWSNLPDEFKSDPDIIQAKKQGWMNALTKEPKKDWEHCPEDLKSDPDIIEARRQGLIARLKDGFTGLLRNLPDEFKSDPDIIEARRQGFIAMLEMGFVAEWIDCPDEFKSDPDIIEARKQGFIKYLEGSSQYGVSVSAWPLCPDEFKSDPDIIEAAKRGWKEILENDPSSWDKCPEEIKQELRSNRRILWIRKQEWIGRMAEDPSGGEDFLDEVGSDPEMLQALKQSWINFANREPYFFWSKCPEFLKSDPEIMQSWKSAFMNDGNWIDKELGLYGAWADQEFAFPEALMSDQELIDHITYKLEYIVRSRGLSKWEELPDFFKQRIPRPNVTAQSTNWYKKAQVV